MKRGLIIISLGLLGCGKGDLFGPSTFSREAQESVLSVTIINLSSIRVSNSLLTQAVQWNHQKFGGLNKRITITIRNFQGKVLGEADIGGQELDLFIDTDHTYLDVIAVLFHELQHLRGLRHAQMPANSYYRTLAKEFLSARS